MNAIHTTRPGLAACAVAVLLTLSPAANANGGLAPRAEGWLVKSSAEIEIPAASKNGPAELAELKGIVARRTDDDLGRYRWWSVGGPAWRWNEIINDELLEGFVTLPLAARHLALFHAALDDAAMVSRHHRKTGYRARATSIDAAVKAGAPDAAALAPSEHAAVAAAAAELLAYLLPARATAMQARAEEAIRVRLAAGVEYPHEVAMGRAIGTRVAALAIARGKADGSDAKWTGTVPDAQGQWKGTNPVAPAAGGWKTWVLAHPSEVRPAAPPVVGSERFNADLKEVKAFARSPRTNHRATYWEVFGGARAHTLWNEIMRTKLLEYGASPEVASRTLAAMNIAFADAGVACWEAKYVYWYPRPAMVDPELKSVFPSPNHPSYPSAHSCLSTSASTVLAKVFPADAERLTTIGKEASEARVWAGIHYRFDLEAGQEIGRKVAEKTLARAFTATAAKTN